MTAQLLPRKNARFLLGPAPTLLLAGASIHGELPPFGVCGDGGVVPCAGWRVMPRLTLCLVDGPDGAGCLIPSLSEPAEMGAMLDWCAAAESAGGVVVVSLKELPARIDWDGILASGEVRGGFLVSIDAIAPAPGPAPVPASD